MFGFGRKPDHFNELMEYLVDSWSMRARFASAFLTVYRSEISALYEQAEKGLAQAMAAATTVQRRMDQTSEPLDFVRMAQAMVAATTAQQFMIDPSEALNFVLVGQAYKGYR